MEDPSSTFTVALNHIKQCNNAKKISRCKGIHWGDSKNITEETKKCNFSPLMLLLLRLMLMMMTMMGKPQWKTAGHTMQWPVSLPNGASAEGKTLMFLASQADQADHNKTNVSKVLMGGYYLLIDCRLRLLESHRSRISQI